MDGRMAPLSVRMRWLGVVTGLFIIPALTLLGSLLAGCLYAVPLFLGAITTHRWPRGSRGLIWLGAFFASEWVVPYAIGMMFKRVPVDLMTVAITLLLVIAGLLTLALDVAMAADAIHRSRTRKRAAV
jgi:hypothetical protein